MRNQLSEPLAERKGTIAMSVSEARILRAISWTPYVLAVAVGLILIAVGGVRISQQKGPGA